MRTVKELELAALTLRSRLRTEGKDPTEGVFHVTHDERSLLWMEQQLSNPTVEHQQERFCGLKLQII